MTELQPQEPGLRLGVAAALATVKADRPWPSPSLPGVLVLGSAPRDQRDRGFLEHGALSATWQASERWRSEFVLGVHDRDRPHWERARVEWQGPNETAGITLGLGRSHVSAGQVVDTAGHFDLYGAMPLAKTAVFNERWIDDGATITWRHRQASESLSVRQVEVGLWRGRAFPGGAAGDPAPTIRLQAGMAGWRFEAFGASLNPIARGAAAATAAGVGHSHQGLDCRESLSQRVCFDGHSQLASLSVRWQAPDQAWRMDLAYLIRRERGTLYTLDATVAQRARVEGGWIDLRRKFAADGTVGIRLERLTSTQWLEGAGAARVASAAGVADARPSTRLGVMAAWRLRPAWTITAELGQQRDTSTANYVALRLLWQADTLIHP